MWKGWTWCNDPKERWMLIRYLWDMHWHGISKQEIQLQYDADDLTTPFHVEPPSFSLISGSVGEKACLREHILSCWRTDVIRACRCPAQSEWYILKMHSQLPPWFYYYTLAFASTNTMSVLFWLSKQNWSPKVDVWQSFPEALSTLVKEGVAFFTFEIYALWQWGKSENPWKEKVKKITIKKMIKKNERLLEVILHLNAV